MAVFHRARGNYWIGATRLASSGLASVLVVLSVFAFWGAFSTYRAGNAAKHFSELSGAFDDASAAVAAEESLERKYRLEPSAEVRGGHHKAAVFLLSALGRVQAIGGPADTALINDVLAMHADYLLAIDHMFAAVDVGDTTRANEIDGTEVDPRFDAMEAQVVAASTAHRAAAEQRLDELAYVQKGVLAATPLVFGSFIRLQFSDEIINILELVLFKETPVLEELFEVFTVARIILGHEAIGKYLDRVERDVLAQL